MTTTKYAKDFKAGEYISGYGVIAGRIPSVGGYIQFRFNETGKYLISHEEDKLIELKNWSDS